MSVPTVLSTSGDGLGAGWLFLALAAVFLLMSLWRRLRRGPVRPRRSDRARGTGRTTGRTRGTGLRPQVGDVWWAEVPFEDGTGAKDRPCLVVAEHGLRRQVLMITSSDKSGRPGYVPIDRHGWGREAGTSWLRVDRRIALDPHAFRRLAGPCPPRTWAQVGSSL